MSTLIPSCILTAIILETLLGSISINFPVITGDKYNGLPLSISEYLSVIILPLRVHSKLSLSIIFDTTPMTSDIIELLANALL